MLRNWVIVYFGNLVGSLGLVFLVFFSHHLDMNGGRIGLSILNTAVAKIQPDVVTLFFKGILCNVLVCLAVWLAYAGRSVTDKIRCAHIAGLRLHSGRLRALRRQHVFSAAGLAVGPDGSRSGEFRRLANHDRRASSTISFRSRSATSWVAPAWSALCTGQSIGPRFGKSATRSRVGLTGRRTESTDGDACRAASPSTSAVVTTPFPIGLTFDSSARIHSEQSSATSVQPSGKLRRDFGTCRQEPHGWPQKRATFIGIAGQQLRNGGKRGLPVQEQHEELLAYQRLELRQASCAGR